MPSLGVEVLWLKRFTLGQVYENSCGGAGINKLKI